MNGVMTGLARILLFQTQWIPNFITWGLAEVHWSNVQTKKKRENIGAYRP